MKSKYTTLTALMLSAMAVLAVSHMAETQAAGGLRADLRESLYESIVDIEFIKQHLGNPPQKGVMLIDSRPSETGFDPGHIPGAVNIPDTRFAEHRNNLPADKESLLIFYCDGAVSMSCHHSAYRAEYLGYTNIVVYQEGYPDWVEKGMQTSISGSYLKKLVDTKAKAMIIDVGPAAVFAKGAIPGAVNIPESRFEEMADRLPADKATLLIIYCGESGCALGDKAAGKVRKLGYTNVTTFPEGYTGWLRALSGSSA